MPEPRRLIVTVIVSLIAASACSATFSPPASTSLAPSTVSASIAPSASDLPSPAPATPAPSKPVAATSQILVRGSARELSSNPVLMAPTRDGHLFVEVPSRASGSTVLARFDSEGRSTPGWPLTLDATFCDAPMPVDNGSVRMLCTMEDTGTGNFSTGRAFAFDASGRALPGWSVNIGGAYVAGGLVGDTLRVLVTVPLVPQNDEGDANAEQLLVSIDASGAITRGATGPVLAECCESVGIGPDGVAYAVLPGAASVDTEGASVITPISLEGRGRAISIDGVASGAAFDAAGRVVMLSAFPADRTSRVIRMNPLANEAASRSAALHFAAANPQSGDTGGCESTIPGPPQIGGDGTIVLYSDVDGTVFALDSSLKPAKGWPFSLPDPLVHPRPGTESEHEAGYCPGPLAPSVGPAGTVYLALEAHKSSVGGSLVAVGRNGRVRAGWPVGLKRAGSEFWSIAVGADGTVYTIAYEPAPGGTSTATLLAIAPDSTILYRTTIIAP